MLYTCRDEEDSGFADIVYEEVSAEEIELDTRTNKPVPDKIVPCRTAPITNNEGDPGGRILTSI